jgi:hypothetical protein
MTFTSVCRTEKERGKVEVSAEAVWKPESKPVRSVQGQLLQAWVTLDLILGLGIAKEALQAG